MPIHKRAFILCLILLAVFIGAGRYADGLGQGDPMTGALMTIDYPHHELHSGSSFTASYTNVTTNNNLHRSAIGFTTPNTTKWFHSIAAISASDPAEVFVCEAATIDDDDGTQAVAYNRNRNSAKVSTVLSLEGTPTAGSITTFTEAQVVAATFTCGTELAYGVIQEGGGPQAVGGVARGIQEWILKQNTTYVIVVKNTAQNPNAHNIRLDWYEHTNR